jgi:hypothetical protein
LKAINRRRLLRGLGSVAVGLPLLDAMTGLAPFGSRALAQAAPAKRFVVWFTGSGSILDKWRPTGSTDNFQLSPILAPLEPHKDHLVVVDGCYLKHENGDAHTDGMGACLTGTPLRPTSNGTGYATGISIDQVIADKIGATTALKSLELSVSKLPVSVWTRLAYAGDNQPIPPEHDAQKVFARLFSDDAPAGADDAALATLKAQRKSVLDAVADDYGALSKRLGTDDRKRIDQHFTAIREIETRLDVAMPGSGVCLKPAQPPSYASLEAMGDAGYPLMGKLMLDLMVTALSCDRTRVVTLMWEHAAENQRFPFIGADIEHHQGIHDSQFGPVQTILTWFTQQQAYLLSKMKEIKERDGTLLDNTLIFSTSEQSNGTLHKHDNMPFLLLGKAGGALKTQRWLRYSGNEPHNNLLVSMLNLMGVEAKTFGKPDWCTGPLSGLI